MKKVLLPLICVSFALNAAQYEEENPMKTEVANENVRLLNQILSKLKGRYNHFNVNVYVQDGEVTLTGTVHSTEDKRKIEQEVQNMGGVKKVKNELEVKK